MSNLETFDWLVIIVLAVLLLSKLVRLFYKPGKKAGEASDETTGDKEQGL